MTVKEPSGVVAGSTAEQAARAILAACPVGTQVILFGSRARGQSRPDSDADFLVIEPAVGSRMMEAARLLRVIRPLRLPADIIVISHDEFQRWRGAANSVFHEADQHGQVLA
jgi:predicted nucleotidyltransferase